MIRIDAIWLPLKLWTIRGMNSSHNLDQMTPEQLRALSEQATQLLSHVDAMGQRIQCTNRSAVRTFVLTNCYGVQCKLIGTSWTDDNLEEIECCPYSSLRQEQLDADTPAALVNAPYLAAIATRST